MIFFLNIFGKQQKQSLYYLIFNKFSMELATLFELHAFLRFFLKHKKNWNIFELIWQHNVVVKIFYFL